MKNFLDDLREAYTGGVNRYWEGREKIAEQVEVILHEKKFAFIPMISHDLQVLWLTDFWCITWIYYYNVPHENPYIAKSAELRIERCTVNEYIKRKMMGVYND